MIALRRSRSHDVERLQAVWRSAVLATHHFLAPRDFDEIEMLVARDYLPAVDFWVAVDSHDVPIGFMGLSGNAIDSLFVDPAFHGQGVGRALVQRAIALGAVAVDVNEQNDGAVGFYRRMGFIVAGRSPLDDQGRPYPLLHLRLSSNASP